METSDLLRAKNINADFYHAGLSTIIRSQKQEKWVQEQTRVMVSTNAFGMGIDKSNVRVVVHYDVPDALESYYQEAGRAGRDEKKSYAVLVYQKENVNGLKALPDKRFPPIPVIKKIYQSLADYLQIPVGIGEGQYYDFDLMEFIKNFKLDSLLVINTLKVLEQEGHLSFSETIFLPSQVIFSVSKDALYEFEESYPLLEPMLKCLLRTYEGIIDNRVSIHEKQLARIRRLTIEEVKNQLLQIQSFGIIEYLPQKDTPQIHFLLNRASAQYLQIDQDHYLQRKKQYAERVENMIRYIGLTDECRSRYIANYFGDSDATDCGVCDNCLTRKRKSLSPEEFSLIETQVTALLTTPVSVDQVIRHLQKFSKEKVWAVLDFMQGEQVISIDEQGVIQKTG